MGTSGAFFIGALGIKDKTKMKKSEKPLFVENLTAEIKSTNSFVLVDFVGLGVKHQQDLKKRLKTVGAKMLIVKNTLLKRAGKEAKLPEEIVSDHILSGPTAIIISPDDPISFLQVLAKFAQEFEIPQFKVGVIEGNLQDKESLMKLSKLPSKDILFSQTIGVISSPLYGLIATLQGNLQKLYFILSQSKGGE